MGLFDALFPKRAGEQTLNQAGEAWQTLTAYRPAFSSWGGNLYGSELVRSAVDAIARHTSKMQVTFEGTAKSALRTQMRKAPNPWQTWGQFLYRTRTILEVNRTCFIVPILNEYGTLSGFFPVLPTNCEIVSDRTGIPYLRYTFQTGKKAAIEMELCGILTKHQYDDDMFGAKDSALDSTMALIDMNRQGITEGVKNGATFRFMAKMNNFLKPEDMRKERERFNQMSFQGESGGLLLFPNQYSEIKQLDNKPFVVDAEQQKLIADNIKRYFGVSDACLENRLVGDEWNSFYEGCLEPFAIQLGDVLTKMVYSDREIAQGNCVFVSSNRMQYLSNADKLNVSVQLVDRGVMNRNEARQIWNLHSIGPEGDVYMVRAEYVSADDQARQDKQDEQPANSNESEDENDGNEA